MAITFRGYLARLCAGAVCASATDSAVQHDLAVWIAAAPACEVNARHQAALRIARAQANHSAVLDLARLQLSTLPDCLADLGAVRECNLAHNRLSHLPALPRNLTALRVQHNQLTYLPPLPATLVTLILNHNRIAHIDALPAMHDLLHANANRIDSLPLLPQRLRFLSVDNNQLADLPALPTSLRALSIANNRLTVLPPIPQSNQVCRLDLRGNRLSDLPPAFELAFPCGLFDDNPWSAAALARLDALPGSRIQPDARSDPMRLRIRIATPALPRRYSKDIDGSGNDFDTGRG